MKKAIDFYNEGYNCAEAIIKGYNTEHNKSIPVALGSPFGSGMTIGSTCGAITAALIVIGASKGREDSKEINETRKDTKALLKKIKDKYGSLECIELKKQGVPCENLVEDAYNILNEIVTKEGM
ncbi:C_GCAxxG_C_C family probable redox protein [Natranaerovirga pectinivora]|uniref:C_GCAxxG_C_C family probable redox protein n=1 Tax=Natranaerovirga pectinivora TaxID=682400 RepID=A0A4R3MSZ9_9FIRM|nr:C-GCAxxG-C-C family (seleno)protein [Natranaerovirga pectinivora]TCT16164.1 C_GCAxxG_C_C family probable redox protein [Natranaerovirga pectinivora]